MSKDYKETLNLPQGGISMKANLSNKEPELLQFWNDIDLYNNLRLSNKDKQLFILHDGPPYANGNIHLGHAVNKILKDVVNKSMTLEGFNTPFVPGWDCHGLPIELNVEKKFGKRSDTVQDKVKFLEACKNYASNQIENQKKDFVRLGVLADWDDSYKSLDSTFEADIVRSLGRIVTNGHLQKGEKPVHWCYDCKSALAEAEVVYKDKISKSIDVKFSVESESLKFLSDLFNMQLEQCSFVIWTTTPWTLPANVAVCVGPKIEYSLVKSKNQFLIVASELVESCSERWNLDLEVISTTTGDRFKNITLNHPYLERDSLLIHGNHVTTESGTGCVHTAPAHGIDDYLVCKKYNIDTHHAINADGLFLENQLDLSGLPVMKADPLVIEHLKSAGTLLNVSDFEHSYPHCWRHKSPLIFASTPQWFISMNQSGLLDGALEAIQSVKWEPRWGLERIRGMLEDRPDWCISRQRNWGVPITLLIHKKTGDLHPRQNILFNEFADLIEKDGIGAWEKIDISNFIDDAEDYVKVDDTLDVWFDSGSTHFCVLDKLYGKDLIADLYLEGSDQHRGWFQSSLLTGIAINGKAPYKSVLTHGFVVDENGRKQSKSLGNVVSPQKVCNVLGADILRLWVASTDFRSEMVATDEILKQVSDQYRRIRNTFKFLLGNMFDYDSRNAANLTSDQLTEIDKWIINQTIKLQQEIKQLSNEFAYHIVVQKIHNFCVNELGGIYLDIIKDRMYVSKNDSQARKSAQIAMEKILNILVRVVSPILSFTSEEIWQSSEIFTSQHKSVFLASYESEIFINQKISDQKWEHIFAIKDSVNLAIEQARSEDRVKGSLDCKITLELSTELFNLLKIFDKELQFIFIVSSVEITLDKTLKDNEFHVTKVENFDAPKCIRCWNKSFTVGDSGSDPEICDRCILNIKGDGEVREFA